MDQSEAADLHILGVRFYVGDAEGAVERVVRDGGLVVVPAAPALKNLTQDAGYRQALVGADFAIADSALMVWLWNVLEQRRIPKLSGLKYLRTLLEHEDFRGEGRTFWVMPTPASATRNVQWLRQNGVAVRDEDVYLAPLYGAEIEDAELLRRIEAQRPKHIVMAIGGGTQERVGWYLKQQLGYRPAIHCIGAAIGFLSGDQVAIPEWVDRIGMGWLWRVASDPRRYGPRYWEARHLAPLLMKYREKLPVTQN
jgi:exopolysaccharide biosynthesis WecB/TagA/CpsF family protein